MMKYGKKLISMSNEYKKYLKKIKLNKILVKISQLLILILFIFIWEYLAKKEIINTFIYSSPSRIVKTIINLHKTNNLYHHIWITLYETLISFSLGTFLGIIIATILWYSKFLYKVIDPYLTIINSLPKVSLGPIIIIIFGANINSIIIMALLISVIITTITVYNGFSETDTNKINLLIISSLKVNVSMSLIGVIMGELLVSKEGIGYLIMYGSQVFNLNLVISGIIILMIVSYLMYLIVSYIEKILIKN